MSRSTRGEDLGDLFGPSEDVINLEDENSSDDESKSKDDESFALTPEQEAIAQAALDGRNVFITGAAGVGKSFLLSHIVSILARTGKLVAVTASTGIAAVQINGITIHAFAGIGLGESSAEELANTAFVRKPTRERWKTHDALVIDEVSMISGELLDKIDAVAKACRQSSDAMGGMQVILCGDFYQLPPVSKGDNKSFAFDCETWKDLKLVCLKLTRVFRQCDSSFINLLSAVREGELSPEHIEVLEQCKRPLDNRKGEVCPTQLLPLRAAVEKINRSRFDELPSELVEIYTAYDYGNKKLKYKIDKEVSAPSTVALKVDTQVVLISNIDLSRGLCNGSRGIVVRFEESGRCPVKGCPQGLDPNEVSDDINSSNMLPVVKFANGIEIMVHYWSWERGKGAEIIGRIQIPLIHAWALTIHKSQGMTIDRLRTSLDKAFVGGMAYVALSRARSLEGLQIDAFNPKKIYASNRVKDFYKGLASSADELKLLVFDQSGPDEANTSAKSCTNPNRLESLKRSMDAPAAEGVGSKRTRALSQVNSSSQDTEDRQPISQDYLIELSNRRHNLAIGYSNLFRDEALHRNFDHNTALKLKKKYTSIIEGAIDKCLASFDTSATRYTKKSD